MGKFCQIIKMSNIWANRKVLFPKVKVLIFFKLCSVPNKVYLEYNIQVLTTEMTGRKPLCIRVQITAVTSAFYFMPVLCVLYSKTLKR